MYNELFELNYSDALIIGVKEIPDNKKRIVFEGSLEQMRRYIEEHPEDYDLTFGEFLTSKMIGQ